MKSLVFPLMLCLHFISCQKQESVKTSTTIGSCEMGDSFVDPRDGETYKIVKIGSQCWFAQNLRFKGNVPEVSEEAKWVDLWNQSEPSARCYYQNNNQLHNSYGIMYNWHAVKNENLCPLGWRIPSYSDWTVLINNLGGHKFAGGKLKGVMGWLPPNTGVTNESGFSGEPGGLRYSAGHFDNINEVGYWWSSTESSPEYAKGFHLYYDSENVGENGYKKLSARSCRCIKE